MPFNLDQPDAILKFAADDCHAAVTANSHNPKAPEYLATASKCYAELRRRENIRTLREMAGRASDDALGTGTLRFVHKYLQRRRDGMVNYYASQARDASFQLGWLRLHGPVA